MLVALLKAAGYEGSVQREADERWVSRTPLPAPKMLRCSNMQNSQNYWNEVLKRYASKDWVDKPTIFAEQIIKYLPRAGNLLELGAGQGQDSLYFACQSYQVTATDLVSIGLEATKQKAETQNLSLDFKIADIAKPLPFPDGAFDIVYSHLGLHYLDHPGTTKLFQEIHRVLKPQGILATLFNTIEDPEINSLGFKKIEDNYYQETAFNFNKRYFSVEETATFIKNLFTPLLLDNHGETYKDDIKSLIRLVARKV